MCVYTHTHAMKYMKKRMKFCYLQQMDGLGRFKLNKSERERQRQTLYDITYMWNLKKYNKQVSKTKKKRDKRLREQTSGDEWGEVFRDGGLRGTNYYVQKKLQRCIT